MSTIKVTINPETQNNLFFLSRIELDYASDFVGYDDDGNELYEIEVYDNDGQGDKFQSWIERQLDEADGVVSYTTQE